MTTTLPAGANCAVCLLATCREGGPVLADRSSSTLTVLGSAPRKEDVERARPFSGGAGRELERALHACHVARKDANFTFVLACRPKDDDVERLMRAWRAENKRRRKDGLDALPSPQACCRGRLLADLARTREVIPIGTEALHALMETTIIDKREGKPLSVLSLRGSLIEVPRESSPNQQPLRVVPTISPSMAMKQRRWMGVFDKDIRTALAWFRGRISWKEPEVIYQPSPEALRAFLTPGVYVYDVETTYEGPHNAKLLCVGIGTADRVAVVGLRSVGSLDPLYASRDLDAFAEVFRWFFTDPRFVKVGHNAGSFDRIIIERHYGVTPAPLLDTVMLHHVAESEYPHDLGFVATRFAPDGTPAWKVEKTAKNARNNQDLWVYNARDVAINARIFPPLLEEVKKKGQLHVYKHIDQHVQSACVGMSRIGMLIDQKQRQDFERIAAEKVKYYLESLRTILGEVPKRVDLDEPEPQQDQGETWEQGQGGQEQEQEEAQPELDPAMSAWLGLQKGAFNPGSTHQVGRLLWDHWQLAPPPNVSKRELLTQSGSFSTADGILRGLLISGDLTEQQRAFIKALRFYRRHLKRLGTSLRPLRRPTGDETADKGCVLYVDGRIHPTWNAHVAVTGRLTTSKPNAQNWESKLKTMFIPGVGHVFVGADSDQIELRIAAIRWGAERYLEAFEHDLDPHQTTMRIIFGKAMDSFEGQPITKGKKKGLSGFFEKMRKVAKAIQYASQYGAHTPTVYRLVTSAEDKETGQLLFEDLSYAEVEGMHQAWIEGCPEFSAGWDQEIADFENNRILTGQGFLVEPVTGRRRDFLDVTDPTGKDLSEIVNFRVQASAAGVMNKSMIELVQEVPFCFAGPQTGLINQCHDALTLEVPIEHAARVKAILHEKMNRREACYDMNFSAEAVIGKNWAEV